MSGRAFGWQETVAPMLSLFASASTLLCCALPALLVTLGLGATLAGLVVSAPWLVALSAHKGPLFAGSGLLLVAALLLHARAARRPCPAGAAKARACARVRRFAGTLLGVSALLWAVGGFFAFLAARLLV